MWGWGGGFGGVPYPIGGLGEGKMGEIGDREGPVQGWVFSLRRGFWPCCRPWSRLCWRGLGREGGDVDGTGNAVSGGRCTGWGGGVQGDLNGERAFG